MTLAEIKAAVDAGSTVHWENSSYTVIKDSLGQYLIAYMRGTSRENFIGLTHRDGETLNGCPHQFYIADHPPTEGDARLGRANRPGIANPY